VEKGVLSKLSGLLNTGRDFDNFDILSTSPRSADSLVIGGNGRRFHDVGHCRAVLAGER
jgi:hypothetical protein